jgi:hypothetical protein
MKKGVSIVLFCMACLVSCKKNESNSGDSNNFVRFKVNGTLVTTSVWNTSYGILTGTMLTCNVTSNMHQNEKTVNINVNAITPGEYNFILSPPNTPNTAYGLYYPKYSDGYKYYSFKSGKFTITELDTVKKIYEGKFQGIVVNDAGEELQITEGEFRSTQLKRF